MLYKIICLALTLCIMPATYPFIITNNSSLPLTVFIQEGDFNPKETSQILHIKSGEYIKFIINEQIKMTIAIMQISISEITNKPLLHSLYSKTAVFKNDINIICTNANIVESIYRKIIKITY